MKEHLEEYYDKIFKDRVPVDADSLRNLDKMLAGCEHKLMDQLVEIRSARQWIVKIMLNATRESAERTVERSEEIVTRAEDALAKIQDMKGEKNIDEVKEKDESELGNSAGSLEGERPTDPEGDSKGNEDGE